MFPKIGVPQNGWFIMENPIKMDDLGVPLFLETPKCLFLLSVFFAAYPWLCMLNKMFGRFLLLLQSTSWRIVLDGESSTFLPETNSKFAPENGWLEAYLPFGMAYFQGLC